MKVLQKILFMLAITLGLSAMAFAQKDGDKKPPPKNPPPVINPQPKNPPPDKPKKPGSEYGVLKIREDSEIV